MPARCIRRACPPAARGPARGRSGDVQHVILRLWNLLAFEASNDEIHLTLPRSTLTDRHQEAIHHYRQALDLGDRAFRGDLTSTSPSNTRTSDRGKGHRRAPGSPEGKSVQRDGPPRTRLAETVGRHAESVAAFQPSWTSTRTAASMVQPRQRPTGTGAFENAIASYGFALVIDEFSPALLQKAAALTMMEDYQQALECYRESILADAPQANTYPDSGRARASLMRRPTITTVPRARRGLRRRSRGPGSWLRCARTTPPA